METREQEAETLQLPWWLRGNPFCPLPFGEPLDFGVMLAQQAAAEEEPEKPRGLFTRIICAILGL